MLYNRTLASSCPATGLCSRIRWEMCGDIAYTWVLHCCCVSPRTVSTASGIRSCLAVVVFVIDVLVLPVVMGLKPYIYIHIGVPYIYIYVFCYLVCTCSLSHEQQQCQHKNDRPKPEAFTYNANGWRGRNMSKPFFPKAFKISVWRLGSGLIWFNPTAPLGWGWGGKDLVGCDENSK